MAGTPALAAGAGVVLLDSLGNILTTAQFHAADNQIIGSGNGILTGGVAQELNASGNLDRQRATTADVITGQGVATGTGQLAFPVTVGPVTSGAIAANAAPQNITLTAVTGTIRGSVVWTLAPGSTLILDPNTATQEAVTILSVNTGTKVVSAVVTKAHAANAAAQAFFYNQARDALIPDGGLGQGIATGATYLFDQTANAGQGGWYAERAASGELDGASGIGTAIAAEYEWNGGGPVLASGLQSGLQFDRARSVQAKGVGSGAITASVAGNANIVLGSAAATKTIQAGQAIRLTGGATSETVYASQTWTPGSSATVPLISPVVQNGQTLAQWDAYVPDGPALNGFLAYGIGIEEEALYDPVSNLFYIERSATQDAMPPQNVVAESEVLWNGTGFDRARGNLAVTAIASASFSTTQTTADQLNVNGHCLHVILDVTVPGTGSVTLTINAKDPASGKYYPLLTGLPVTTQSTNVYRVGPALTAAANAVANDWVPRIFQIVVTANNANPVTYSVGYNLSE